MCQHLYLYSDVCICTCLRANFWKVKSQVPTHVFHNSYFVTNTLTFVLPPLSFLHRNPDPYPYIIRVDTARSLQLLTPQILNPRNPQSIFICPCPYFLSPSGRCLFGCHRESPYGRRPRSRSSRHRARKGIYQR